MSKRDVTKTGPHFFVLSAPSGTGKTTIARRILQEVPHIARSVSITTRLPRSGEKEGVDYRFVTKEEFRRLQASGSLFEWQEVHGDFYGTPKKNIEEALQKDRDLLLDIDTRGAAGIKAVYPQSKLIFCKPPSSDVLEARLRARRTEDEEAVRRRLETARRELGEQNRFDYVIINDDLETAVQEVKKIIDQVRQKG